MTIEDRVRQLMADAVADEPPPRRPPRGRPPPPPPPAGPGRRGALVLVLAAVVGLVAVRTPAAPAHHRPDRGLELATPTPPQPPLRYPPDWVLRERAPGWSARPTRAGRRRPRPAAVRRGVPRRPATTSAGRPAVDLGAVPGGQAYLVTETTAQPRALPPRDGDEDLQRSTGPNARPAPSRAADAGRPAGVMAGSTPSGTATAPGEAIVGTIAPSPRPAVLGDRGRPACRPDQWRLFHPVAGLRDRPSARPQAGSSPRRAALSSAAGAAAGGREPAGRRLLAGNPSTTDGRGRPPEDAQVAGPTVTGGPLPGTGPGRSGATRACPRPTLRITAGPAPASPCPDRPWPTRRRSPRPAARTGAAVVHRALAVSRRAARAPRWWRRGRGRRS